MKKILVLASICSLFAACSKSELPDDGKFSVGEKVTICVSADSQTKVTGALNSDDEIAFVWESGDKIKVSMGSASSVFTLKSGEGTATATFEGIMPASADTYDVQFPATDPVLTTQDYVANGLPHNMMKVTATGCKVDELMAQLKPAYSAIKLNLYGKDQTVGKIVITDNSVSPSISYTLNSPEDGVALSANESESKPFFAVLPAGSRKFKVDIYDNAATKALICSFETANAQTFNAGVYLNMPEKKVKPADIMFSVSATKTVKFSPANLYWDGTNWHFEGNQTTRLSTRTADHIGHFYYAATAENSYSIKNVGGLTMDTVCFFDESNGGLTVEGTSGYYLLSMNEWKYLLSDRPSASSLQKAGVSINDMGKYGVIAPDGYKGTIKSSYTAEEWAAAEAEGLICLAPSGRAYWNDISNGNCGEYMSTTLSNSSTVYRLYFYSTATKISPTATYNTDEAYCVRLVKNYTPSED